MMAAIAACYQAIQKGREKIHICTDSQFLFHVAAEKIPKYKAKNWQCEDPYMQEIKALSGAMSNLKLVKIQKVAAHSGIHGNEQADRLAKDAARRR